MKNPIILKDLLIAINGIIWKCLSVLIIITLFILVVLFWKEAHHGYSTTFPHISNEFEIFGYLMLWAGVIFLSVVKSIFSITTEKSGLTHELIFISKITSYKYIMWKFFSNILYFAYISLLVLPFCGVFLFFWWIWILDIIMLYFQIAFYIIIWSAIWIFLGVIGRKMQISLVLWSLIAWIIVFLIAEYFYSLKVFFLLGAPYDMILGMYSLSTAIALKVIIMVLTCIYFLWLSVRFCKEETELQTERYPWYCSLIVFILAAGHYYLYEKVWIEVFIFLSFFDAILFFINTKSIAKKDYLISFWYIIINVILTVVTIIFIDWFLFQTLLYYIMCMGVLLFISLFVQLYFRAIHRYIINMVNILILGLIFIWIPWTLYVQNTFTLPEPLRISDIWSAFETKYSLDINWDESKYNYYNKRSRVNNTYHYNLFMLILFVTLFWITHRIRKQSIDV